MSHLKKTVLLKIDPEHPDEKMISRAAEVIRAGGLVAFPTETVYGLGVNALDDKAIELLCAVKNRPQGKPFTMHIADTAWIEKAGCEVTKEADRLIKKYWPGPLTLILNCKRGGKIGFRMPDNAVALSLIKNAGVPVAAPSANVSGDIPPVRAEDVLKQLDGKIDILLDSGPAKVGVESTVVDMSVTPPVILREGAIKEKEILKTIYE
ncbi:MAG: L-threonylcarbamoyladenylate synthase [Candidatus Omnitrophica bacterium]|nr:L-threonylcarbamoyladenylate synthase [Candidatus Omnitrophota bacterium]